MKFPKKNQIVTESPASRQGSSELRFGKILRNAGISPTSQRLAVAEELLSKKVHLSAEEVANRVRQNNHLVSRATVYNTLRRFVDSGLIRQVFVAADRVLYDSNTEPHHHFYDPDTGKLSDIESTNVQIEGLPELPEGRNLDTVELIVRLKPRSND